MAKELTQNEIIENMAKHKQKLSLNPSYKPSAKEEQALEQYKKLGQAEKNAIDKSISMELTPSPGFRPRPPFPG